MQSNHDCLVCTSTFPSHVSPHKEIRDASSDADKKLTKHCVDIGSRFDVYQAVLAYSETQEAAQLEGEAKRFLEKALRNYRRKGMHLDEETRGRVRYALLQ